MATTHAARIGIQIILLRSFVYLHVSTGISKVDKVLKMLSDSISDSVIFQNFLRAACPQTSLVLARIVE